ncbi:Urb1 protein [Maudiozyma humilis]|uniref:Urb1 protein n=1 Tax=Maudiozyma humilis TaxID=51915 RepID=A0AAV5S245_MAUHU|nr:Urb1 protein [Kazachstania humilis]
MNSSGWKYSGAAAQRSGAKEQRAEGKKGAAKFAAGNEVDNGVLDALENILKDMAAQGDSRDYQAMVQFFRKGFGSQVVQTWSYYVQTNNHAKTSHSTSLVARTLTVLAGHPDTVQFGSTLIQLILTSYAKVIYRCLNNLRAQVTNPVLRLMKAMVSFDGSRHLEEFLAYFDFSLASLPRLLTPSKSELEGKTPAGSGSAQKPHQRPMRETFLDFWILLVARTPAILRRDLLTDNAKIMGAWFKYMDKVDSDALVDSAVTMFTHSILEEPFFKRTTKCKVLNELTISKLHSFYHSQNKDLVKKINHFFVVYGSSPEFSIAYPDNCVWFSESPVTGINTGAPVTVQQREFKLHNKLLFNLLRIFKPWEDDMQSATVVKILQHTPELVPPYCAYIASLGSHDPKMTSYWFGMTLLLGRMIRLPIPQFVLDIETDATPNQGFVLDNILPSPLTKVALTKALQDDNKVICQLACQLIVFAFQKLDSVLNMYSSKGWGSERAVISSMFLNSMPDLGIFTSVLANAYASNPSNQILPLSVSTILGYYSRTFPNFFSVSLPTPNIFTDIMKKTSFTGMEVTIIDKFLQFQKFNGTQMKWWNATKEQNSLFTSLLRLASSKNSTNIMTHKIDILLADLLHGTVIFNTDLLASPMLALINSLQVVALAEPATEDMSKIWKLLDECVSRCVKTVYKYVDMSQKYHYISPFLMALAEQWKYVDKTQHYDIISKWFGMLLRSFIYIGESQSGIQDMANELLTDIPEDLRSAYLTFSKDNTAKIQSNEYFMKLTADSSFAQYLSISTPSEIENSQRVPINDLDAATILVKLKQYISDEELTFDDQFRSYVIDLCSSLANYCAANSDFKILDKRVYVDILEAITSTQTSEVTKNKAIMVIQTLVKVSVDVSPDSIKADGDFQNYIFQWLLKNKSTSQDEEESSMRDTIQTFISVLSNEQLVELISETANESKLTTSLAVKQLCGADYTIEYSLLSTLISFNISECEDSICDFIRTGRVSSVVSNELLDTLMSDASYSNILRTFIGSSYFNASEMRERYAQLRDRNSEIAVAIALSNEESLTTEDEEFVKKVVGACFSEYRAITSENFRSYFQLFALYGKKYLSESDALEIVKFATTEFSHKFSDAAIEMVCAFDLLSDECITKWLGKMTLYITKVLTERSELSEKYQSVIKSFTKLVKLTNLWDNVNSNVINAQLEAIFDNQWLGNAEVMEYATLVVLSSKKKFVESARNVQFILNNEVNPLAKQKSEDDKLPLLVATVLYKLFTQDPAANSNVTVQKKLLTFYSGSISCEDRIILAILELIESTSSIVWTNDIITWDFLEDEDADSLNAGSSIPLIEEKKEGLILTLNKADIAFSTDHYVVARPAVPTFGDNETNAKSFEKIMQFHHRTQLIAPATPHRVVYDPVFLLLVSIQNTELVTEKVSTEDGTSKQIAFSVQKYLSAGLLQFVIGCLGDSDKDIVQVSTTMLTQMMYSLEQSQQFKEGNIFKVLLKKIVYSLVQQNQDENAHKVIPLIWYSCSRLCELLSHPTSQLYEKAYKWVLNGPTVRNNDVPLLYELIAPSKPDIDFDHYFAQLAWVLKTLENGVRTKEDVEFLKRRSAIEWLSNTQNIPYLNANMHSMINAIVFRIQRIDDGGSAMITRFAGISDAELKSISLESRLNTILAAGETKKTSKKELILREQLLNNAEILESYVAVADSQKRVRAWTNGDAPNILKRVCRR